MNCRKKYQIFFKAIMLVFISLKLYAYQEDTSNVVAVVGKNYKVTFLDLRNFVDEYFYNKIFLNEKSKGYIPALNRIIINRLKVFDFFERGLNNNKKLMQNINRAINEELFNEYYELKYANKYVTDSAIRKAYKIMDRVVSYRQILINKPYNATPTIIDSLRNLAYLIKSKIETGENFSELVKIYSDDETNVNNGGIMPPVDWKKSLMSEVNNIIFNLPTNSVRIIETSQSFYIVKIDDIKKVNVEPLEKVKEEIRLVLREAFAYLSLKDFEEEQKKLINEDKIVWNKSGLEKIVNWSKIQNFYDGAYRDTINKLITKGENFIILSSPNYRVDLKKFFQILNDVLIMGRSSVIKEQDVKNFILEALKIEAISKKARQLGLEKKVLNPYLKSNFIVDQIVKLYDQEIIDKQIPEPDEFLLKKFYEENKDSLYYQLAKVNIYLIIAPDTLTINKYKEDYKNGIPFERLSNRVLVKRFIKQKSGEIKLEDSNEKSILGELVFNMNVNDVIGPILYEENEREKKYALIKCVYKREEKQLTYDDVKENIRNDYMKYKKEKFSVELNNRLKNKYGVRVFDDVLKEKLASIGIFLN
ncbi:MAG: peptidyl-prolyl cis-trans isomerase [Melioribacter sp.]|nr:peptidyl-prolyl cis-trans isomerase [Melioribacter sp.]